MRWNFELLRSQNCLRININEQFNLEDQSRMFSDLDLLEEWKSGMPLLFDNRLLEMQAVSTQMIKRSVQIMQNFSCRHTSTRIACLVNEGLNFGLGRQFGTYVELEGFDGFRVFTNEESALEWLTASEELDDE